VLECDHNAPISVSNEVCDGAEDRVSVETDLVNGCLFVLGSNKNDLAFSVNSLSKLDVLYTRLVVQCIQDC
jgi:hypothetical protein